MIEGNGEVGDEETIPGREDDEVIAGGEGADVVTGRGGDTLMDGDDAEIFRHVDPTVDASDGVARGDDFVLDFATGDTIDLDALFDVLDPARADGDGDLVHAPITVTETDGSTVADFAITIEDFTVTGSEIDSGTGDV